MTDIFCARCGEYIPEGTLKYIVHIQVIADSDECESLFGLNPSQKGMGNLLTTAEDADTHELADEGYQEILMYLCKECKSKFTADPFSAEEESLPFHRYLGNVFH